MGGIVDAAMARCRARSGEKDHHAARGDQSAREGGIAGLCTTAGRARGRGVSLFMESSQLSVRRAASARGIMSHILVSDDVRLLAGAGA